MVLPGLSSGLENKVHLIDLSDENKVCKIPGRFPKSVGYSGAFLDGKPLACSENECYFYDRNTSTWIEVTTKSFSLLRNIGHKKEFLALQDPKYAFVDLRYLPGFAQLNETHFWVTEGTLGSEDTTEIFSIFSKSWELSSISLVPDTGIYQGHCNVQIDESRFLITGGETGKAYIIDIRNGGSLQSLLNSF